VKKNFFFGKHSQKNMNFHFLRATWPKSYFQFAWFQLDTNSGRFKINVRSPFSFERLIFQKITKNLQKRGHNSSITTIKENRQTRSTLSFFNIFQWNLVCTFILLCWIPCLFMQLSNMSRKKVIWKKIRGPLPPPAHRFFSLAGQFWNRETFSFQKM